MYRAGWTLQAPPVDPGPIIALRDAFLETVGADSGELEWKCFSWDGSRRWYAHQALTDAGFQPQPEEAVLVAETSVAIRTAGDAAPGITVRVATSLEDREVLLHADSVSRIVWGEENLPSQVALGYWARPATTDPPHLSIHVAYHRNVPVAFGRFQITPHSHFGGLWGGATIPEARRLGYYRALVGSRAHEARGHRCQWLMVDANPQTSMPILLNLGFRELGRTRPYQYRNPQAG